MATNPLPLQSADFAQEVGTAIGSTLGTLPVPALATLNNVSLAVAEAFRFAQTPVGQTMLQEALKDADAAGNAIGKVLSPLVNGFKTIFHIK